MKLKGKAENLNIKAEDLDGNECMELLIQTLDELFSPETIDSASDACKILMILETW